MFNEAIEWLNSKLDTCFTRLEGRFEEAIETIKDTVITRLQEDNATLQKRLREVQSKLEVSLQYQRRNNVIIDGLPAGIPADELVNKSLKETSKIGQNISRPKLQM